MCLISWEAKALCKLLWHLKPGGGVSPDSGTSHSLAVHPLCEQCSFAVRTAVCAELTSSATTAPLHLVLRCKGHTTVITFASPVGSAVFLE